MAHLFYYLIYFFIFLLHKFIDLIYYFYLCHIYRNEIAFFCEQHQTLFLRLFRNKWLYISILFSLLLLSLHQPNSSININITISNLIISFPYPYPYRYRKAVKIPDDLLTASVEVQEKFKVSFNVLMYNSSFLNIFNKLLPSILH